MRLSYQSAEGRSQSVSAERLVNMYAESSEQIAVLNSPGLVSRAMASGPCRGLEVMGGTLYSVNGSELYSGNISLGTIDGAGLVDMANNGTQLVIVTDQGTGYVYTTSGGLSQITDPDFPSASSVDYLDGYFLFTETNTGIFFISAINDATDFDALDFASAESAPDNLVRVFVDHREVWLMGIDTNEIWVNTGNVDFPFERQEGAINEKGCAAKFSVTKTDNSLYWLDRDGIVRRADAYNPMRISTHDIEYQISQGDFNNAEAFSYTQEGHEFYVLTVPNSGTFVYDAATQLWHERESRVDGISEGRWRASSYARIGTELYVGDFKNGNIYTLDLDTYTENGEEMVAVMAFPPLRNEGQRFIVNSIRLDMEAGTADEPEVMMETSRDGRNWANESRRSFGKIGEYAKRVIWRRLGLYEVFYVRFSISDNAKRVVFAVYAT